MKVNNIIVLFDISGSMKEPFNSITENKSEKKLDELMKIIDRICEKGERKKNEIIKLSCILFGGTKNLLYDFCNLLIFSDETFNYELESTNNKKGVKEEINKYRQKFKELLSNYGPLFIDKYLYGPTGPSERLCEMAYKLMKNDKDLCEQIYKTLPKGCKSFFRNLCILGISKPFHKKLDNTTTKLIDDIYNIIINKYTEIIINHDISERKKNNKLNFLDGNNLIQLKKKVENKLEYPKSDFKFLDIFEKYIYGETPLYGALKISFENLKIKDNNNENLKIKDNNNINKFIFIISDGDLTDRPPNCNYIAEINKNANELKIYIISIFLTSNIIPKEEIFYDSIQPHFSRGSVNLFKIAITLTYENAIIKFFIKKGWNMPLSGECKLFVEINNSQNLNKFIDLMNEAISELNDNNNTNNSLINIINTVKREIIVSDQKNNFKYKNQITPKTCYANAVAASIFLASAKIIGRRKISFDKLREKIIKLASIIGKRYTPIILEIIADMCGFHFCEVNEEGARKAIIHGRPCVARFGLNEEQWKRFLDFYKEKPYEILTEGIMNPKNYQNKLEDEEKNNNEKNTIFGHAVVLTHISRNYLKFLNSWGNDFADNGYFKIEKASVLNVKFYDIFWTKSDLSIKEIEEFKKESLKIKDYIKDCIFN